MQNGGGDGLHLASGRDATPKGASREEDHILYDRCYSGHSRET